MNVSATDARQRWAQTLDDAALEPVTITSHGRAVAVMMNASLAERALQALEDAADVAAADAALVEISDGAQPRLVADIAAELGIDVTVEFDGR